MQNFLHFYVVANILCLVIFLSQIQMNTLFIEEILNSVV